MASQEEREPLPSAPTAELQAFEPFVQWLLAASPGELASLPAWLDAEASDAEASDGEASDDGISARQPTGERRALAEAEAEFEALWDLVSLARREHSALGERLLELQSERDESRAQISLLERRIIKRLQDRDLAIAQTYTTEQQIRDAERFKTQPSQPQDGQQDSQQSQPHQRRTRVALAIRGLLQRHGRSTTSAYGEKDVQQLQRELADTKVATALAKAERDSKRHALRGLERQCGAAKLELAQARAEEDDLQASLQQLSRFSTEACATRSAGAAPEQPKMPPSRPLSPWTSPLSWRRRAPFEATCAPESKEEH